MENSNQNCVLGWLDEGNEYFINKETFNRALVVGGHNESLTATFICKVNDYIKWGVPSRGYINIYLIYLRILNVSITELLVNII